MPATYSEMTVRPPRGSLAAGDGNSVYLSLAAEIDGEWTRLTYFVNEKGRSALQAAEKLFFDDATCIATQLKSP